MGKLMISMTSLWESTVRHALSAPGRQLIFSDDNRFLDCTLDQKPDYLILELTRPASFYVRRLLLLHQQGVTPFIILMHCGRICRYATSSPLEVVTEKHRLEIRQIESSLTALLPQMKKYSHVEAYTGRFEATEYLREIISGVSEEAFSAIVTQQHLRLASRRHYLMLIQITSPRRFDDYTFNRDVFYFMEEIMREEVYALLEEYGGGELFGANKTYNCILFNAPDSPSSARCMQQLDRLCSRLVRAAVSYTHLTLPTILLV